MKWIMFFVIFTTTFSEEVLVRVTAKVLTPLKIEIVQNVNFGDIFKGGKNYNAKERGELKVTGNGRVKLLWKDISNSEFQSMNKNLPITMSNETYNFKALVFPNSIGNLDDFQVNENADKVVKINGKIESLDKSVPCGDYSGVIVIRAEYLSD